jgi:hypothetical protein
MAGPPATEVPPVGTALALAHLTTAGAFAALKQEL